MKPKTPEERSAASRKAVLTRMAQSEGGKGHSAAEFIVAVP
jgi:hypothetical protein